MPISIGTVALSMILSVVLGFIWYGPLFGKAWKKLSGIAMPDQKPSFKVMIKPIALSFIGAIFMSFVLSSVVVFHNAYYGTTGVAPAMATAFLLWLGFIVPAYLNLTGWEAKPWKLFFINTGYWLAFLLIVSVIVA